MLAELEGVGDDLRLARDGKRHTLDHLAHAGKESMVDEVGRRFDANAAHLTGTLDPKRNRNLPFELRVATGTLCEPRLATYRRLPSRLGYRP